MGTPRSTSPNPHPSFCPGVQTPSRLHTQPKAWAESKLLGKAIEHWILGTPTHNILHHWEEQQPHAAPLSTSIQEGHGERSASQPPPPRCAPKKRGIIETPQYHHSDLISRGAHGSQRSELITPHHISARGRRSASFPRGAALPRRGRQPLLERADFNGPPGAFQSLCLRRD